MALLTLSRSLSELGSGRGGHPAFPSTIQNLRCLIHADWRLSVPGLSAVPPPSQRGSCAASRAPFSPSLPQRQWEASSRRSVWGLGVCCLAGRAIGDPISARQLPRLRASLPAPKKRLPLQKSVGQKGTWSAGVTHFAAAWERESNRPLPLFWASQKNKKYKLFYHPPTKSARGP